MSRMRRNATVAEAHCSRRWRRDCADPRGRSAGMKTKSLHSSVIADVVFILVPYSSPEVRYRLE